MSDNLYNQRQCGWAVIRTHPGYEEIACDRLLGDGFRVYLPRQRIVLTGHRSPRGRGEVVLRPMLPRYLFAWLDEDQWIMPAAGDRWRHWYTPWDRRRAFVSDAALDVLRAEERREGAQAAAAALPRSQIGETVSITRQGERIDGVVQQLRGKDRLIIETISGRRIEIREADAIRG